MGVKIGDVLKLKMSASAYQRDPVTGKACNAKKYPAKVVYIHPDKRYFVVEFDFGRGFKARESVMMCGI